MDVVSKMVDSPADVLKVYFKQCFKSDNKKIFIKIREIRKDLLDLKIKKEDSSGNEVIRVHTSDEKAPLWYIHGYTIPLKNLGISKVLKRNEMLDLLNIPKNIPDNDTKTLLRKIIKDYGEILDSDSRNKYEFKTERFKKQKDYMRVKRKSF